MKYRLLIFDLDNTIFDYNAAENNALKLTFEYFNLSVTEKLKLSYREINERFWQQLEKGEISSEQLRVFRFEKFGQVHGIEWNAAEVSRVYLGNLGRGVFLVDGAEALLSGLRDVFRIGAVTNGISDVQRSRIGYSPFADLFDPLVISDEVGAAKPDPAIFEIFLEKAGIENRSEILMIGDSLTSDIAGAAAAGIPSCWFNPAKMPLPENCTAKPDFIIDKLGKVADIVFGG